jgi:hypothetical protein
LWQNALGLFRWGAILDHGVAYMFHLYWYVYYSGDKSLLFELKDKIIRYCDWLNQTCRQHGGLLPVTQDDISPEKLSDVKATSPWTWCNGPLSIWIDTCGFEMQRHKKAALNIYYYGMLNMAVKSIAEWLDEPELAQLYVSRASNVKELTSRYFQDEDGLFVDNLPWLSEENGKKHYHDRTLSMALLFGLTEEPSAEKKALKLLCDCPDEMGFSHPPNAYWRLRALSDYGKREVLLKDLRDRWGEMTSLHICNTLSEGWALNGELLPGAQCQCGCAGPHYAIISGILGVKPAAPAFAEYEIKPMLDELESYSGMVYASEGSVKISFNKKPELMLALELPAGKKAVIKLSRPILSAWQDGMNMNENFAGKSELEITPQSTTKVKMILK